MKIYSGFISLVVCSALFLTSFSPLHGQFSPIESQPNIQARIEKQFNAYWKSLKDFQECFTGKKVCSPREKAIKTATLTAGALILLSLLLYIIRHGPKMVGMRARTIEEQIQDIETNIKTLRPQAAILSKKFIRREFQPGMVLQPGETVQEYKGRELRPDPQDPKKQIEIEVTKQMVVPRENHDQEIMNTFTAAETRLEEIKAVVPISGTEKERKKTLRTIEKNLKEIREMVDTVQESIQKK